MEVLEFLDPGIRRVVAVLAADVIEHASSFGDAHWGVTPFRDGQLRVNVGWTEILTAQLLQLRLIVDGRQARTLMLPDGAVLHERDEGHGYYPSIPESVCIELPYVSATLLERTAATLHPALLEAVRVAARRASGRGVKAGHSQEAQAELARLAGRRLPPPRYAFVPGEAAPRALERMEGALRRVVGSEYERNPAARRACVEHYGATCAVCGFSFEAAYGEIGHGFIHVHHLVPLSSQGKAHHVDPVRDLRPVCPNCHAMLHSADPPLTIKELQDHIAKA